MDDSVADALIGAFRRHSRRPPPPAGCPRRPNSACHPRPPRPPVGSGPAPGDRARPRARSAPPRGSRTPRRHAGALPVAGPDLLPAGDVRVHEDRAAADRARSSRSGPVGRPAPPSARPRPRSVTPNACGSSSAIGSGPPACSTSSSGPPCSHSSCRHRPHGISGSPSPSTQDTATSRPPPLACSADTRPHSAHRPTPYEAFSTLQPTTPGRRRPAPATPTGKSEYGAYARRIASTAAARSVDPVHVHVTPTSRRSGRCGQPAFAHDHP